jgi:hypothetical protein
MERSQSLNLSSPIVQRVLRIREHPVWPDAPAEPGAHASAAERAQSRTGYQWQMWQKSDLSAYVGEGSAYRCKGTAQPSGQEAGESEMRRVSVLSSGGQID